MKPGWKTTEFWLTLMVHAGGAALTIMGQIEAVWAVGASAVVQSLYTWGRSYLKTHEPG